jgi:hypothetical protein
MTVTVPLSNSTASRAPRSTAHALAGSAAMLAVIARIASIFLWPPDADASHARMLATAGAHPSAWYAATWAEVVCWVCAGAAIWTATGLVHGRGLWPTRIGGYVCGASVVALGLVGGSQNAVTGILGAQPDAAAMVAVQDAISDSGALLPFVVLIMLGELLSMLFAVGLWRARLVGWWFPVLAVLAFVGFVLTSDSSNHLVILAGFLPLGAMWLALARLLFRHS